MQAAHGSHRETGRETPADARGDQHVTLADVRTLRDVRQGERVAAAGAVDDGAQARPRDLHRHGMVGIGDQQGDRAMRSGFDHLAQHAAGIDQGLAHAHAVVAATIEHEALPGRIEVHVQHADQAYVQAIAAGAAEQGAQAHIFRRDRIEPLDACLRDGQRLRLAAIVSLQAATQCELLASAAVQPRRRRGDNPQRRREQVELFAGAAPVARMLVGQHQRERHAHVEEKRQHRQRAVAQPRCVLSSVAHASVPAGWDGRRSGTGRMSL